MSKDEEAKLLINVQDVFLGGEAMLDVTEHFIKLQHPAYNRPEWNDLKKIL